MIINNPTNSHIYFNKYSKQTYNNLYEFLNIDLIKNANFKAHENNISYYYIRPDKYQEVLKGFYPIPPKSIWKYEKNIFSNLNNKIVSSNFISDFPELISVLRRLSIVFKNKSIAVELSGGLDTSIIIGLINYFDFSPFLIGVRSNRYEFRTESFIQDYIAKKNENHCLLDSSALLPFSHLLSCPRHQLPSESSLCYLHALQISETCKKKDITIILSGMGFDSLLCENPIQGNINSLPDSWQRWMLDDNWFNEYIYNIHGINYKSAIASQIIIKAIWTLRKNESEDFKKWWARNMFSEFIPNELVNYAYKTDNIGEFLEGLINSTHDISKLFEITYEITKLREFTPSSFDSLFDNLHLIDEMKGKAILARVSFANWIYGLVRDKKI